jgi:pyrroline-5-carboxylate reductase
MAANR